MKRTGALRVLGLWISPMGDRAEGALIASDGTDFELLQSEVLELAEPERVALGIGGQKAAQVAEDCAAQLFERFEGVELVGFQGPVLRFERGITLEAAGNGDVLAEAFGVPVAWNFLAEDFRLGGASLLMNQAALASAVGASSKVLVVSLDTRIQATWVENGVVALAQETGPGLGLMSVMPSVSGGRVAEALPEMLVDEPFFSRMGPRLVSGQMTDRIALMLSELAPADAYATALAMIVAGLLQTIEDGPFEPKKIYISGPGSEMADLREILGAVFEKIEGVSIPAHAAQAAGVGLMAVRLVRKKTLSGPTISGVPTAIASGQISGDIQAGAR